MKTMRLLKVKEGELFYQSVLSNNLRIFGLLSFWRYDFDKAWKENLFLIYRVVMWLNITIGLFLVNVDLLHVLGDIEATSYNLCMNVVIVVDYIKALMFQCAMFRIEMLVKALKNNLNVPKVGSHEDIEMLNRSAVNAMRLTQFFIAVGTVTCSSWMLIPFIDTKHPRRLPFKTWLPPAHKEMPYYVFAYLWHLLSGPKLVILIVNIDVIFYNIVFHLLGHYNVMEKNIRSLSKALQDKQEVAGQPSLADIVQHHQAITNVLNEIEDIYFIPMSMHFGGGSFLLAVIGFDILHQGVQFTTQQFTQLCFVGGALINLFLFCFFGTALENKSFDIANALYDLPWYDFPPQHRRALLFMLMRAQWPPKLTSGKTFYVTLATYIQIVRLAYSTLLFLRDL